MLQSLKLAGTFDGLKGLIVGGFTDINDNGTPFGKTYQRMILDATKGKKYPILFNFPAGHFPDNKTLIFGRNIKLSINNEFGNFEIQ
jgi:muramoyltetrapeptide carboxypeptidase